MIFAHNVKMHKKYLCAEKFVGDCIRKGFMIEVNVIANNHLELSKSITKGSVEEYDQAVLEASDLLAEIPIKKKSLRILHNTAGKDRLRGIACGYVRIKFSAIRYKPLADILEVIFVKEPIFPKPRYINDEHASLLKEFS